MRPAKFPRSLLLFLGFLRFAAEPGLAQDGKLRGEIHIDGSSTVFPISEAAAKEFSKLYPGVRVNVGLSGTGGGFRKFSAGEIDITNASRPIQKPEIKRAQAQKVAYLEYPITKDGVAVVVNKSNTFVDKLSLKMLREIWEPGSRIKTWKDLNPSWPNEVIKLYGPGPESGTFDFFTEFVMGTARLSRNYFVASEDDDVLVKGVIQDKQALAYLGYSYLEGNKDLLRHVPIQGKGTAAILPSVETIQEGVYPLSRPLLIYVNVNSAKRPEVKTFIEFLLKNAQQLAKKGGYVPLSESAYAASLEHFQSALRQTAE